MLTLAIDTATYAQAIAVVDGPTLKTRFICVSRQNHADTLLENIDHVLKSQGVTLGDLDLISVGVGPGSFTGVRVGISTAKALAFSHDVPIVGVSTLAAIARPLTGLVDGVVVAAVDARRGEVYHAGFDARTFDPVWDERAESYDSFCEFVTGRAVAGIGAGFRVKAVEEQLAASSLKIFPQPWDGPSAPSLAWLGQQKFEANGPADLSVLEPNYIRLSDAEIAHADRVP